MVNYGYDKKYHVQIENVDFYPELAGIKIANLPFIVAFAIIPLWFNHLLLSITLLFTMIGFFYYAARREDEGRPVLLNSQLIALVAKIPAPLRGYILPSLAPIKPCVEKLRR